MGWAKERLMELQARGYGEVPDKYVCADCFSNSGIKKFIIQNAASLICSYCGRKTRTDSGLIAASLEDVVGLIIRSIRRLYGDPNNSLPWDNEDQCYVGITCDLHDVLGEMGLELTSDDAQVYDSLYNDLVHYIDCDLWTDTGAFSKKEAYQAGWRRFVEQVKHNSRYTFSLIKYKPDPYEDYDTPLPSKLLPKILSLINESEMRVVLKKGTAFYRARIVSKGEKVNDCAKDLGPPRKEDAVLSNRMSPAGIPMFYGALDKETAIEEIRAVKHTAVAVKKFQTIKIARFVLLKEITVVDFSHRQECCLFDENISIEELNAKAFLNHFVRELSMPIKKDGREHIEYVPTQIVAEYLKYKCHCIGTAKKRIKGILYPSAQYAGVSSALFLHNEHCVDVGGNNSKAYLKLLHVDSIDWAAFRNMARDG